jgi:hypothetical protein
MQESALQGEKWPGYVKQCVFVAFGIQHGMCVIQSSVACLQHFLRYKRHDVERKKKKKLLNIKCVC